MFLHFHRHFWHILWEMKSVILVQIGLIVLGAFVISLTEARPFGEALYFAFITGLTVGYGDIVATSAVGQVISVLLGLVGLLFTGLIVAMAVRALQQAWTDLHGPQS